MCKIQSQEGEGSRASTSWSTDAEIVHFLYFIGSENRCKATSSYKADKELCFALNEQTTYLWQRDEWTVGNNEQPALAKVSEWKGKACGRTTYMWYSAAGSQLMGLAKPGQGIEKSECYITESI